MTRPYTGLVIRLMRPPIAAAFLATTMATACASNENRTSVGEATSSAVSQTGDGLTDAALSPLEDFNLRKKPIPERLRGLDTPYFEAATTLSCADIAAEIEALSSDVGRDWDTPASDDGDRDIAEWAADRSASATLGAVSSQARGFIPFRGLVREATGAEAHAAKVQKAFRIGAERRAFLKGVGLAKGCPPPASPLPPPPEEEAIDYRGAAPSSPVAPKP